MSRKAGIAVRISPELANEIRRIQNSLLESNGIRISFPEASRVLLKKKKGIEMDFLK